jgi:hypothetical protein
MTKAKHSPAFREGILQPLVRGDVLVPPVRAYLNDPNFGGMKIEVPSIGKRAYDGWFHPSEHTDWSPRALMLYLIAPHVLAPRMFKASDILAMTAGSIWHSVIQYIFDELNLVTGIEVPLEHKATNARGKADAMRDGEIIELKTMRDMLLRKIESPEDYIARFPGYHRQALEYMRMSGVRKERVMLIAVTYPFEMKEFVIDYDMIAAHEIAQRYQIAIQAAADRQLPMCGACNDDCPVKHLCQTMDASQIMKLAEGQ